MTKISESALIEIISEWPDADQTALGELVYALSEGLSATPDEGIDRILDMIRQFFDALRSESGVGA